MREIKFRAWATENKKMFHDVYFDDLEVWIQDKEGEPAIIGDILKKSMLQHCILMQYTGLKDKNGKEVYEGDIVEVELLHYPESNKEKLVGKYISTIIFQDGCFVFYDGYEYRVPCQPCFKTKIIGNTYENPDLAK